jgi:hypothetical protein
MQRKIIFPGRPMKIPVSKMGKFVGKMFVFILISTSLREIEM